VEIKISVDDVRKHVRLEVDRSHTVGEVVEQIIEGLDLPRDRSYSLVLGKRVFGPDRYSLTIGDLGVKDGGRLKLTSEIVEPTPPVLDEKVYGYIVDHGGVVSISKMSDELGILTQELDKSLKRLIAVGRLEKTEDRASVPEVRKIETFRPEPEWGKRPPYIEERRIDRRRYLKYAGLTAAAAVTIAGAYGFYEYTRPPPTIPTPTPTPVPTPIPTPTKLVRLNVAATGVTGEVLLRMKDRFDRDNPGIEAMITTIPQSELFEKLMIELVNHTGAYDVIMIKDAMLSTMTSYLDSLDGLCTADDKQDFLPQSIDLCKDPNGELKGIPVTVYVHGLYCRMDLFRDPMEKDKFKRMYGYDLERPYLWGHFRDLAEFFTRPPEIWGFVVTGARNASVSQFLDWLYQAGGDIFDKNGNIILNEEPGVKALGFMVSLVKVSPLEALSMDQAAADDCFLAGRAAMLYGWPLLVRNAKYHLAGKFEVVPLPEGVMKGASITGFMLSLPSDSKHKEEAKTFIKYMTSLDMQREMAKLEMIGCRRSLLKSPDMLKENPWLDVFMDSVLNFGKGRPKVPYIEQVMEIIGHYINSALSLEMTPKHALDRAADDIRKMIERSQ